MKRRDAGRVLTFAVTGALLGGVGVGGCHHKHRGPYTNPGPSLQPPGGTDPDGAQPEPEPETPGHVNEGPVEEPPNPGPQPEPEPEPEPQPPTTDPGTNNVRKIDPPPETGRKYVNTVRVVDEKEEVGPGEPVRVNTRKEADPKPPTPKKK